TSQLGAAAPQLPYRGSQFGQTIEGIVNAPGQPSRETTPIINQPFSANTADHFSSLIESGQHSAAAARTLPKETRMGVVGSEAKETAIGAVPVSGAAAAPANYGYAEARTQNQSAVPGARSGKLNWKHYTAAGAIVSVGLIAAAIGLAMVLMRKPPQPDKNPLPAPQQGTHQPQQRGEPPAD